MIKIFLSVSLTLLVFTGSAQLTGHSKSIDTTIADINFSKLKIVGLPRPNSGTYTYEQAGKRKDEIYSLRITNKFFAWKNPTSGGAVHINKRDEIEVYQFTFGILESVTDSTVNFIDAPKDTVIVIKNPKELHYYVGGIGLGNPASVLITSEISLYKSEAIKKILEQLWEPGTQLYYLTERK